MFKKADLVILNKMDMIQHTNFNMDKFKSGMSKTNPDASVIPVSAVTGDGFDQLLEWILQRLP